MMCNMIPKIEIPGDRKLTLLIFENENDGIGLWVSTIRNYSKRWFCPFLGADTDGFSKCALVEGLLCQFS